MLSKSLLKSFSNNTSVQQVNKCIFWMEMHYFAYACSSILHCLVWILIRHHFSPTFLRDYDTLNCLLVLKVINNKTNDNNRILHPAVSFLYLWEFRLFCMYFMATVCKINKINLYFILNVLISYRPCGKHFINLSLTVYEIYRLLRKKTRKTQTFV